MEQKKLLWVLFSTVGFILVVSVVGVLVFNNRSEGRRLALRGRAETEEESREGGLTGGREFDPYEWVQNGEDHPGLMETETGSETTITDLHIGESGESGGTESEAEDGESKAEAAAGIADGKDPHLEEMTDSKDIEVTIYTPEEKEEPAPAPQTRARTATAREQTRAPKTVNVKEYWIQTGSYASKFRAEEVKGLLAEKVIANVISTTEVDSSTYYRVRIGPYSGKEEAEKFLQWIRDVNGFESSYVSMVYVKKRVN
jgi:hypothetical protein